MTDHKHAMPGLPGLLAVKYNTTGGNKTTTSATQADIDATNAAVTFTAPASGNILVRISIEINLSGGVQNAFLGLRESTTNLVNGTTGTFAMQGIAAASEEQVVWTAYLTSVSAGSHTYKAAFSVNGSITMTVRQAAASPLVMEVWAAP